MIDTVGLSYPLEDRASVTGRRYASEQVGETLRVEGGGWTFGVPCESEQEEREE